MQMQARKPLISIVTPSYNSGRFIEDCIKSILEQDYPHIEHIIQDGGSTDQTKRILKKYQKQQYKERIQIFIEQDKGQSDGLNRAIQKTKGEIILVLNADDMLMPYACTWVVKAMNKYPEAAVIYGDNYVINEEGEITGIHIAGEYDFEKLLCVELIPPAQAAFIRRLMFKKVGLKADASLDTCPDYEMWIRITQKFPMKHVFGVITKYRVHQTPQHDSGAPRTVKRFVAAKKLVMDRVFNSPKTKETVKRLRRRAYAGLDLWASTVSFQMNKIGHGYFYLLKSFVRYPSLRVCSSFYMALKFYPFKFHIKLKLPFNKVRLKEIATIWFTKKIGTSFDNVSITNVKDFWDARPCNIMHSKAPVGTKRYFDEVEKRKYFVEPHIPKFAQFEKWKGKKVLEIGCGIGTDTINFARSGAKVTAVEISKKSLEIAQKRARVFNLQNQIKFYSANAEELSRIVPVETYDLIYSFGVIHHTPHPYKVIQEIKKYAHEGTVIKIMIYYRYSWKVLWILFKHGKGAFWKIRELISTYSEAAFGSPVTYTYSKSQAKDLMDGFRIYEIKTDHIFPYEIDSYKQYKYKKVWYFKFLPKSVFRFLETNLGWHLLISAKAS